MKKVIFMGTPDFSVPILEALVNQDDIEVIAVVTQPDRKVGRKKVLTAPPVKQKAQEYDLLVLQPKKISQSEELDQLLEMDADLIITAAFGQVLPESLLEAPTYGSINVHASLLPKYRGAAPIHYAIWNGDEKTGVTIMYMVKKMDAGDMISQADIDITDDDDTGIMFDKLSLLGRDLLIDTLPAIFNDDIDPKAQDPDLVSQAPMISRDQEQIDWTKSARDLFNQIRAFRPFPGTYTILDGNRFKIWDSRVADYTTKAAPGNLVKVNKEDLHVACGGGTVLALKKVQPAGKSKMPVESYLAGANLEVGDSFDKP